MFKKILIPLDGSELGELTLPCTEELARKLDSQVDLICVCEPAEHKYHHMAQLYIEKVAEEVRGRIKASYAGETKPIQVKPVVLSGKPASEIIDYAEKNNIDLIVMTSHGRSGPKPWDLGSTVHKVIERISKPILLVRADSTNRKENKESIFSNILVPLDDSENGEVVLPYIKELTNKLKSKVILLRVIASGYHVHTVGGLDYISLPETQVERMKAEASPYLTKISHELESAGTAVSSEVRTGDAAEKILKLADEKNAHLITMSTHGHSGIERWTLGSVTHKVLHNGKTSLLLVRASTTTI